MTSEKRLTFEQIEEARDAVKQACISLDVLLHVHAPVFQDVIISHLENAANALGYTLVKDDHGIALR